MPVFYLPFGSAAYQAIGTGASSALQLLTVGLCKRPWRRLHGILASVEIDFSLSFLRADKNNALLLSELSFNDEQSYIIFHMFTGHFFFLFQNQL